MFHLLLQILLLQAQAADTSQAFSSVPSRFRSTELTLGSRGLGELCYSRDTMPDGTVCNPSQYPFVKENLVLGRAFIGNGYDAIRTAHQFIFDTLTKEFLQSMFNSQNVTSIEGNLNLVFNAKYLGVTFAPYRVQFVSELSNPNFPVVAVHAAIERKIEVASGVELDSLGGVFTEMSTGVKMRFLDRQFVHGSFSLFDAISSDPRTLLPAQSQRALLFDPTLTWHATRVLWQPRFTIGAQNIGFHSSTNAIYPDTPDMVLGLGVEPYLGYGRLRLGVDVTDVFTASDIPSRFKVGGSYRFGIIEVMSGWNSKSTTAGIIFGFKFAQVGIVYEFIRYDLSTNAQASSKIATEFSVRM